MESCDPGGKGEGLASSAASLRPVVHSLSSLSLNSQAADNLITFETIQQINTSMLSL